MSDLVTQVRRLQYAANMLDYHEFCTALGLERDSYSKHKFQDFQELGGSHRFDGGTLDRLVAFYEEKSSEGV